MTFAKLRTKPMLAGMAGFLLISALILSFVALSSSQALAAVKGVNHQTSVAGGTSPNVSATVKIITDRHGVFTFSPKTLRISVGTTVTWKNMTTASHTSTSDTGVWDSGIIGPGGTFSFKFTHAGTFNYDCSIHPFMEAVIIVH